jgi:hypothetical protein
MGQFSDALASINFRILKLKEGFQRPVVTNRGTYGYEKLCKTLLKELGHKAVDYPDVYKACLDIVKMEELVTTYAQQEKVLESKKEEELFEVPEYVKALTLNCNIAAKGREDRFFCSTEENMISAVSGESYLLMTRLQPADAMAKARHVIPEYMPRRKAGIIRKKYGKEFHDGFNTYVPPDWKHLIEKKEYQDRLPPLFDKLVKHLFPIPEEREFFFAWLHDSLFKRSYTFLILCGAPGTGKNRLKLVMRALHGHDNTVDGKKSTLTERFNSQLSNATLAWFDELHYDMDMENVMKELQNDSISIERKGVDATRATQIHSSIVISNNKPRDNYIAFDARKFAPLKVTAHRLEKSMTSEEIDDLTKKVEDASKKSFDVNFLAQIAQWVRNHGKSTKWPNQEYRGPMFWSLAHTSMSRWQKKAATLIIDPSTRPNRVESDPKLGLLWSSLSEKSQRKNGDRSLQFPDNSSVKAFFEIFRDSKGQKAFKTTLVGGKDIMGDFYVKPLLESMEIVTEASIAEQRGKAQQDGKKKEKINL